ncbi:MAG: outer membrane beta-barrel protein [Gammaproteobacteria bacterium]|nr:outer membrane beta-barrel protein [Gammaproteobacteria bacterium]
MGQVMFSARAGIQIIAVTAVIFSLLISAPKVGAAGSNWYVGASIPVMYIDDTDTITTGSSAANPTTMPPTPPSTYRGKAVNKYDTGFKLEGVIGYELGSNVRVELELFYSEADVDKLIYSDVSTTIQGPQPVTFNISEEARPPVSGSAEQVGAMLNLWYDIDLGSKWTPYIGVGVGVIEVDFGDVKYDDNALAQHVANEVAVIQAQAANPGVPREALLMGVMNDPRLQLPQGYAPSVSTTDTVFAYQAAAGVSYQFKDNLVLRLGYRYQTSDDLKFKGRSNPFGNTVNTKTDFDVQFIEIGFRYHF